MIGKSAGKKVGSKEITDKLRKGTGKMGIISVLNEYSNHIGYIEIEELEVAGNITKVIIHDVTPNRTSKLNREEFLTKWGGNDWVRTEIIRWYDNNTQRLRDSKIEEIFKKSE
jgi:hypothetical protein